MTGPTRRRAATADLRYAPPRQPDARQAARRPCAVGQSRLARTLRPGCRRAGHRADRGGRRRRFTLTSTLPPRHRAARARRRARRAAARSRQHCHASRRPGRDARSPRLCRRTSTAAPTRSRRRALCRGRRPREYPRFRRAAARRAGADRAGVRAVPRRLPGKASPVHFFWGSFDLAVTRFSGREAPSIPAASPAFPTGSPAKPIATRCRAPASGRAGSSPPSRSSTATPIPSRRLPRRQGRPAAAFDEDARRVRPAL